MKGMDCRDLPVPGFFGAPRGAADPGSPGNNPPRLLGCPLLPFPFCSPAGSPRVFTLCLVVSAGSAAGPGTRDFPQAGHSSVSCR